MNLFSMYPMIPVNFCNSQHTQQMLSIAITEETFETYCDNFYYAIYHVSCLVSVI